MEWQLPHYHYILDNRKPVPVDSQTWSRWRQTSDDMCVAETMVGNVRVDTEFIGLDNGFHGQPPLLFETMAFIERPEDYDEWRTRCETWEEAEAMHATMCERVKAAFS